MSSHDRSIPIHSIEDKCGHEFQAYDVNKNSRGVYKRACKTRCRQCHAAFADDEKFYTCPVDGCYVNEEMLVYCKACHDYYLSARVVCDHAVRPESTCTQEPSPTLEHAVKVERPPEHEVRYQCVNHNGVAFRNTKNMDDTVDFHKHGYVKTNEFVEHTRRDNDWLLLSNHYWVPLQKNGRQLFKQLSTAMEVPCTGSRSQAAGQREIDLWDELATLSYEPHAKAPTATEVIAEAVRLTAEKEVERAVKTNSTSDAEQTVDIKLECALEATLRDQSAMEVNESGSEDLDYTERPKPAEAADVTYV